MPRTPPPVAVIDIGSNSGRVVVFQLDAAGQLRVLAGTRAALRLIHDVDEKQRLTEESMARAMEALRDFQAIARGAGANRTAAFGTEAMRAAANSAVFIDRVRRELGIRIELIDGRREAEFAFLGAVRGLPVASGMLFDLGGGSLEVSRFRGRRPGRSLSLPLGALRLSERFLQSDPPRPGEIRRLRDHVRRALQAAGVTRIGNGEHLLGTGGTLRNLAKIDVRARQYPITRLHGYVLTAERMREIASRLAATSLHKREAIPGLSAERADSIVGGAVVIDTLLDAVRAPSVLVSGQGAREGLAYRLLQRSRVPRAAAVRDASLASLTSRFDGWRADSAERRRAIAAALVRRLDSGTSPAVAEALDRAALLLDIGRSIDFFNRHQHAADIVLATELNGFGHEEIALLAAILRRAGDRRADLKRLRPLVGAAEREAVERAAVLLVLADDIAERCPPGGRVALSVRVQHSVVVEVPRLQAWRSRSIAVRFQRAFGKPLDVTPVP